jgi:hypothetical protein
MNNENTFVQGYAVVAERGGSNTLRSFHDSRDNAGHMANRSIDTSPLQVVPAEVLYAINGNVRMWRSRVTN